MGDGLIPALWLAGGLAAACWLASVLTREYSWVDRLWSIAPPIYVIGFAVSAGRFDPRLVLMALISVMWGARLTYNFVRKGGYRPGGEDYRWPVLRERMSPALFALFNVVFICAFQHGLLLLLALPAWVARRAGDVPLNALDALAALGCLACLVGETVADRQQWDFHVDRARRSRQGQSGPRFLTTGLFRYSRHPNFFCEQGLWWFFYLFGVAATGTWWNVSLAGPVLLTLLFQGSTSFTESITLSKYPEYRDYQRLTSRLVPLPPRNNPDRAGAQNL